MAFSTNHYTNAYILLFLLLSLLSFGIYYILFTYNGPLCIIYITLIINVLRDLAQKLNTRELLSVSVTTLFYSR